MIDRLIIVDGYNLIHRTPTLRPGADRTLEQAREKLLNLLSWAIGSGEARFIVVFDGAAGVGSTGSMQHSDRVEVRFSRPPQTADDLIRRLVEDRVDRDERVTVVTADLEVARHARAMGADISISDLFLASALDPAAQSETEKPASMSKKELEDWAELFRSRSKGPEEETEH